MNVDTRPDHIDDLIAGYLVGEATPDQVSFVEAWRNENESNRKYFEQLKLILEKAASVTSAGQFDTDAAWKKLRSKLQDGGAVKTIPLRTDVLSLNFFVRIAAGLVILLMAGFFTYRFFNAGSTESVQILADKKTLADTLPDGSDVFLNRRTKIEYEFNKANDSHTAKLVGEAYFHINHNDRSRKTFIVEAEGVFIKDIGTSFNVKAYPDSPTIEVVVEEGEVMFYSEGNPGVYLRANGKGIYNKKTKIFTVSNPEPNVTAYKTKFFSFSANTLATVVQTLNEVYAAKIRIDDKLKNCRLTVSFNNENIDEIADVIAETLGLTVKRSGDVIRLEGTACVEK